MLEVAELVDGAHVDPHDADGAVAIEHSGDQGADQALGSGLGGISDAGVFAGVLDVDQVAGDGVGVDGVFGHGYGALVEVLAGAVGAGLGGQLAGLLVEQPDAGGFSSHDLADVVGYAVEGLL